MGKQCDNFSLKESLDPTKFTVMQTLTCPVPGQWVVHCVTYIPGSSDCKTRAFLEIAFLCKELNGSNAPGNHSQSVVNVLKRNIPSHSFPLWITDKKNDNGSPVNMKNLLNYAGNRFAELKKSAAPMLALVGWPWDNLTKIKNIVNL